MSVPAESGPCHRAGGEQAPVRPWADDDRADAKDALLAYAVENAYGVPLSHAARAVFGPETEPGDADYQLARRFYTEDYAHLFKITRGRDLLVVEPEPWAASLLIASIGNSYTADSEPPSHDDLPRERAASFLSGVDRIRSDAQRALLLRYLADQKRLHGRAGGDDDDAGRVVEAAGGTVTVGDRFTSPAQAAETGESLTESCAGLRAVAAEADGVEWLTHVSLTLAREAVASPEESTDALKRAIEALHGRWRRPRQDGSRDRPGEVPPHVLVVEAQGDLTAHAHVVYAGRPQPEGDLFDEWAEITDPPAWKPPQVSVESVPVDDDAGVERVCGYLGGTVRDLRRLAAMSAERLEAHADDLRAETAPDEVRRLARLALPFATEARVVRASPGLRDAAPEDVDPSFREPAADDAVSAPESVVRGRSTPEPGRTRGAPAFGSPPNDADRGVADRDRPPPVPSRPPTTKCTTDEY